MDPFNQIAFELRQNILCHLETRQDVMNISRASPIMFHQARKSKVPILGQILPNDLPGGLFQDAIAILKFPSRASAKAKEEHLQAWGRGKLLLGTDTSSILALNRLYWRIRAYIDDYLAKAVGSDLCRSYLRLPSWSHSSHLDNSLDRLLEEPSSGIRATLSSVSIEERNRLLGAFLRYDLICRVNYPQALPHYGPGETHAIFASEDINGWGVNWMDSHEFYHGVLELPTQKMWDWQVLSVFDGKQSTSTAHYQPWVQDMLHCVHEYVTTLYRAMCVRSSISTAAIKAQSDYHRSYFLSLVAGFGLDLLDTFIRSPNSVLETSLIAFDHETEFRLPSIHPGTPVSPISYRGGNYGPLLYSRYEWTDPSPPQYWKKLCKKIWLFQPYDGVFETAWSRYRQRAWAFFDDDRYCPGGWNYMLKREHQPLEYDVLEHLDESVKEALKSSHCRATRNTTASATNHDSDDSDDSDDSNDWNDLSEEFKTGKLTIYPSLEGNLVPFWQ
ncbi:hypothetical protein F4819DRAFT_352104 [Hypoxylon fuscum]|nr:hypothetical protein F4819DRAFT_352104 [Hypoxylon fuscum]